MDFKHTHNPPPSPQTKSWSSFNSVLTKSTTSADERSVKCFVNSSTSFMSVLWFSFCGDFGYQTHSTLQPVSSKLVIPYSCKLWDCLKNLREIFSPLHLKSDASLSINVLVGLKGRGTLLYLYTMKYMILQ